MSVLPRSRRRVEGLDEAAVVALVEPDAGLVEHVEDADEAGADLGGEPDALGLAARERPRSAGERQVVESHVEKEAEPGVDLLEDLHGDLPRALVELGVREERARLANRQLATSEMLLPTRGRRAPRA